MKSKSLLTPNPVPFHITSHNPLPNKTTIPKKLPGHNLQTPYQKSKKKKTLHNPHLSNPPPNPRKKTLYVV